MRAEQKVKPDGAVNFLGGQDSRRNPALLEANQVSFAVNVTFRGGYCSQRPPFTQRALTFPSDETLSWFQTRTVQAAIQYQDDVAVSIGGRVFLILLADWSVVEVTPRIPVAVLATFITPPANNTVAVTVADSGPFQIGLPAYVKGDLYTVASKTGATVTLTNISGLAGLSVAVDEMIEALDPNLPTGQAWMVQAENFLVVQDGASAAIIYDGSSRRARTFTAEHEVPTGTAMAFGNGRLWVAVNRRQFVAGDINHGPTNVIQFTENSYIANGGAFTVPGDAGSITAMVFMPTNDTSLGQGPLQIFTENSIYSVNLPFNRDEWSSVTNPIQTMSLRGFGAVSEKSVAMVNGDLFYRSRDGVRSYVQAVREFNTWGNVPISSEMGRVTETDPSNLLHFCSAAVFDNRFLFTTSLQPDDYGAYANALGVLDFDPLSYMGRKNPPVWDGFWTGLDFRLLVAGEFVDTERCFALTRDTDGDTRFWELLKAGDFDSGDCKIKSFIETKSHNFGSLFELKRLEDGDLWFDNLVGDVDWDVKYRQDQSPCWKDWTSWTECQTAKDCPTGSCWTPAMHWPGYRTRRGLLRPACVDDLTDNKPSILGYEFQARIEWSGRARLRRYLLLTREEEEAISGRPL